MSFGAAGSSPIDMYAANVEAAASALRPRMGSWCQRASSSVDHWLDAQVTLEREFLEEELRDLGRSLTSPQTPLYCKIKINIFVLVLPVLVKYAETVRFVIRDGTLGKTPMDVIDKWDYEVSRRDEHLPTCPEFKIGTALVDVLRWMILPKRDRKIGRPSLMRNLKKIIDHIDIVNAVLEFVNEIDEPATLDDVMFSSRRYMGAYRTLAEARKNNAEKAYTREREARKIRHAVYRQRMDAAFAAGESLPDLDTPSEMSSESD